MPTKAPVVPQSLEPATTTAILLMLTTLIRFVTARVSTGALTPWSTTIYLQPRSRT